MTSITKEGGRDSLQNIRFDSISTRVITHKDLTVFGYLQSLTLREHELRVPEKRVLRRTYVPKKEEVTRGWREKHNEELIICTLHKVIRVIKSRRMT
jgi:hypothetical protein